MGTLLGWIGSICFAICGAPQAFKCVLDGHGRGLSRLFLSLWLGGELCYVAAVWMEFGWVSWMMVNYILNIVWILVILKYMVWPRNDTN